MRSQYRPKMLIHSGYQTPKVQPASHRHRVPGQVPAIAVWNEHIFVEGVPEETHEMILARLPPAIVLTEHINVAAVGSVQPVVLTLHPLP